MDAAGVEPLVKTIRMGGKTYSRNPKEEIEFLDETKTTSSNIEDDDDDLA
jgi:hypothetical protein